MKGEVNALRMVSDDSTFAELYEREVDYVFATLQRLRVPAADLPDVAHDVFLVVHARLHTWDRTRPVRPWLFGIALRVVADLQKSARVRREVLEPPAETPDPTLPADEQLARQQDREMVHRALGALELDFRAVFILHDIDGVSIPEIAEPLSVSINTLYSRLRIARKKFTEAIRREQLRRGAE